MKLHIFILLLMITQLGISQTVKVIDKSTLQPIENVVIHNEHNDFVLTDDKGMADIGRFSKDSILIFKHAYYQSYQIRFQELEKINYLLKLRETVLRLGEVEIPSKKWEQNKEELPIKISGISAKEVLFHNPQTSADLLGTSSEVFIQKSQMGGGSPMIRGFAANRVLIVVDGVRMNNAIYRSGNLQNVISIDPQSIENAEVIYGPGSVVYGSDAMGGIMDFHSFDPKLSTTDKMNLKLNAATRYSTANSEKTGHLGVNYSWKKIGCYSSISYSDFGDMRMGSNRHKEYQRREYVKSSNDTDLVVENKDKNLQKYTAYKQYNILQKIRIRPNDKLDIVYGFHYSTTSDIPRYDRLIQYKNSLPKYAEWYYGPQKWMMNVITVKHKKPSCLYDEAKATVAYQNYEESRNSRKIYSSNLSSKTEKVNLISLNYDLEKAIKKDIHLFYGMEGVSNYISSEAFEKDVEKDEMKETGSRYPDGSVYKSFAAYLSIKKKLSGIFTLNTGGRYTHIISNSEMDTSFYKFPFSKIELNTGAFNGSIGLVCQPIERFRIYTNLSSGFRAPNIDDVGKVFDSEPGKVVVPNENLTAEYLYNGDLGFMAIIQDRFQIEITGFYSYLHNAMVRRDFTFDGMDSIFYEGEMSKVQAVVNTGMAYVYGGHFSVSSDIGNHFSVRTNVTKIIGEEEDEESGEMVPLRHAPPLYASLHLLYLTDKLKIDFYGIYNDEISNEHLAISEQDKAYMYATDILGNPYSPSWMTVNLKVGYQLNSHIHIMAGIENITDVRYRPYSSGMVASGRNLVFGVRGNL